MVKNMIEILLFSNSNKNIEKIKKIIGSKNFKLSAKIIAKKFSTDSKLNTVSEEKISKNTKLMILDISGQDIFKLPNVKYRHAAILNNMSKNCDIAKLIILSPNQKEILSSSKTKFEDFIFQSQLQDELLMRINLMLARQKTLMSKNSISVEGLVLNLDKYELSVNGKLVELTFKEYELLKFLLQNQNKVFSRSKLLSKIWGYDFYGGSRTVDVHIRRLRFKIAPYDLMIKTIRNVGYIFIPKN